METPTQEVFNEMHLVATHIWKTYDNTHGYVDGKLNYINSIDNVEDNAMVFFRMFDIYNQEKMVRMLSNEAIMYVINNK
jgi:hypothetical protein